MKKLIFTLMIISSVIGSPVRPLIKYQLKTGKQKRLFCSAVNVREILEPLNQLPQYKKKIFAEYISIEKERKNILYPTKEFLIREELWSEHIKRNDQLTEAKKRFLRYHTPTGECIEKCLQEIENQAQQ